MLKKENKKIIFFLLVHLLFSACSNQKSNEVSFKEKSQNIIGVNSYDSVYKMACDSIGVWTSNNLGYYQYFNNLNKYKLDSLLCFNKEGNKFISGLLIQHMDSEANSDGAWFFYGVKVRDSWLFFDGPSIVLPRDYYQKDIHTPLSFEKLHEIAMKEVYGGYLNGGKINEHFFERIPNKNGLNEGYGSCFDCKTEDEYYLYLVKDNWTKRDTSIAKQDSLKM